MVLLLSCGSLLAQEGDYQKGLSYYKQQQYEKAIEEFEKIVEASPDYESGFRILGDCYLQLKDYDRAAAAFQKAIASFFILYFSSTRPIAGAFSGAMPFAC